MQKRKGFERVGKGVWTQTLNGKRVDIYRAKTRSLVGCRWEAYFLEIDDNHALLCGLFFDKYTYKTDSFANALRVGNLYLGR